jgi:hypothetical protein
MFNLGHLTDRYIIADNTNTQLVLKHTLYTHLLNIIPIIHYNIFWMLLRILPFITLVRRTKHVYF